ncbi:MAG TPA: DUF1648 domain-containing protein [Candidatus Paceibacterota bacterium]|nr:DUF1648 domain-containing protein [Verrucomicrobiota bacterium]HSA11555.1 DUF1648 domain-containing protein [Candidatus Paceibacterota bacterium]
MKKASIPLVIAALLYLALVGHLTSSISGLPERMATHFDAGGQPDGWSSRASYVRFMLVFGLAFPLFAPAVCYAARFLPDWLCNIPHRGYWLAPERRRETLAYLFSHSLWLAPLMAGFVIGTHLTTIQANRLAEPQLSSATTWAMIGTMLAGIGVWLVPLIRRFKRVPREVPE